MTLTPEEIEKIYEIFELLSAEGNLSECKIIGKISDNIICSEYTVKKYLRERKLIPEAEKRAVRDGGRLGLRLNEKEIKKIKEAHSTYNGNAAEAARNLPYSPPTIRKIWRQAELSILPHGGGHFSGLEEKLKIKVGRK